LTAAIKLDHATSDPLELFVAHAAARVGDQRDAE
jgi:hypothetical protein